MCLRNFAGNLLRAEQLRQDDFLLQNSRISLIWIFYKNFV